MDNTNETTIAFDDVVTASKRIMGIANKTPIVTSRTLNKALDAEVYFKCENLQRMGAFKFRGAYNFLSSLSIQEKTNGVIAFSSGNHAQAVALAAQLLGIKSTIVMPKDAPLLKLNATKDYGGKVILYDRYTEDRQQITTQIAHENNLTIIPPFNSQLIIAGQGTAAKELFEEIGQLDALLTPLGGGGLLSGSLITANYMSPQCKIYGVEPLAGNDGLQSIQTGRIISIKPPHTIADGAQTSSLGTLTFPIIQKFVNGIFTVNDEELVSSMRFFAERMKLIVEPTACLGLAALIKNKNLFKRKKIGIIISGGNVDLSTFSELIATYQNN